MLRIFFIASIFILGISLLYKSGEKKYAAMNLNPAEEIFLRKSGRLAFYPQENISVIETDNAIDLGKLTALSFLHWILDNPTGVIALPTGKTPELFIEYLKFYKENWQDPKVRNDLLYFGISSEKFPDTSKLKFVQLDEFYPIDANQKNSFTYYIKEHYLKILDITEKNVLTMDFCSSHTKYFPDGKVNLSNSADLNSQAALREAERECREYEEKIASWGGIGFFLGGIGPDGHIAFNMPGADPDSKTRLVQLNYPTAAASAGDLGGIEYSRDKVAATIGLGTITLKPGAVIIIIAAGEAKAKVIADAIEIKNTTKYPGCALHGLRGAKFYLTKGAAKDLKARKIDKFKRKDILTDKEIDEAVIDLAIGLGKEITSLKRDDFLNSEIAQVVLEKTGRRLPELLEEVRARLITKIDNGLKKQSGQTLLHTGPHHDDIMLSYHPLMKNRLISNRNHFAYFTSGFNSVTNDYMLKTLRLISFQDAEILRKAVFVDDYQSILQNYLKAVLDHNEEEMQEKECLIMLKKTADAFAINSINDLQEKIKWLQEDYFPNKHPGEKDISEVQILKGSMRESESERMLLMAGVNFDDIYHLRARFYTGDYFTPMPTIENDARPFQHFLEKIQPNIVTVALDPEGTGPDTHYKVLQVVSQGLKMAKNDPNLKIWGYRNIWHSFSPADANFFYPATDDEISKMNFAFLNCFSTQKQASFPSPSLDGPFSLLAEKIQREQFENLQTLLGKEFFAEHHNPDLRNARGFIFIKEMNKDEFFSYAQELKARIELM